MTINFIAVPAREIAALPKKKGKYTDIVIALEDMARSNGGLFIPGFSPEAARTISTTIRDRGRHLLRMRSMERDGEAGMYLWLEPVE